MPTAMPPSKFSPEQNLIGESSSWMVTLRPKQVTLGSLVLLPRRPIEDFDEVTEPEAGDLFRVRFLLVHSARHVRTRQPPAVTATKCSESMRTCASGYGTSSARPRPRAARAATTATAPLRPPGLAVDELEPCQGHRGRPPEA